MGGGGQVMKRIPLIKFPPRHPIPSSSAPAPAATETHLISMSRQDVPPPPSDIAVGGKASLQPKRTPISDREIEAILLGGCS